MNEELKKIEDFLIEIVSNIVSQPDKIQIHFSDIEDEEKGEMTITNIKVATEDIPVCIGAGGTVADSIRRLCVLLCRKIGYKRNLFVRIDAPKMPKNHFEFKK